MQSIGDIIQALARQRNRGESGPLIALRQLDGAQGERISHLPVDRDLASAWPAMTGEPFRPHHAQALAALRRGEPVALSASTAAVGESGLLLLYAALTDEREARALMLTPDEHDAHAAFARITRVNAELPASLRLSATLLAAGERADPYARVVVAAPEALHSRVLRHHERAWRTFWPALRLLLLPDLHRHTGIAGAHLADLLLRTLRVIGGHGGAGTALVATLPELTSPEAALTSLIGQPWRVVAAADLPRGTPVLAVWHGGTARLRDAAELATTIQRQGYRVHIACGPLERAAITPVIGDSGEITVGPGALPAHALVVAGFPGSTSELRRMVRSGYQAVVVVLGELPIEQALARHVELLLAGPPAAWPPPTTNAYVTAQHVLCAASELPLTAIEVESWGAQGVVDRLVAHRQLIDLPDPEVAWKPSEDVGDPYADFTTLAASGAPILARNEQGHQLGAVDPTGFERWTFPGAALPAGAGGMRVLVRDEEHGAITLRMETSGRRTYPLRRCTVELREARDTRTLAGGRQIGWGRVIVEEQIEGYREQTPGQSVAEVRLAAPLAARWAAPACWFDVGSLKVHGQLVGWSLAAALPLRALASFTDVVPCYDQASGRLYLVDAQPGGSGLAVWAYTHAEELLPLAHDVAVACSTDPLLEPASRADRDWLLTLLGGGVDDRRAADRRLAIDDRRPAPDDRRRERQPAPSERRPVSEPVPQLPPPRQATAQSLPPERPSAPPAPPERPSTPAPRQSTLPERQPPPEPPRTAPIPFDELLPPVASPEPPPRQHESAPPERQRPPREEPQRPARQEGRNASQRPPREEPPPPQPAREEPARHEARNTPPATRGAAPTPAARGNPAGRCGVDRAAAAAA
jgi:hypothetical protein